MKIIRLHAENVKRLSAVEITPTGDVVTIGGQNGAGKSSVLDAIAYALGGEKLICEEPLRRGAEKGKVTVDLGEYVVTRTFTPGGGGSLTVTNHDGARFPSPQALLDRLVGKLSFDPLAFAHMKPADQREQLRALVGLDFTALDAEKKKLETERTIINAQVRAFEAQRKGLGEIDTTAPAEPVNVRELMNALAEVEVAKEAARLARADADRAERIVRDGERKIVERRETIEALTKQIAAIEREIETCRVALESDQRRAEHLLRQAFEADAALTDPAPIRQRLAEAETVNAVVRRNAAIHAKMGELTAAQRRQGSIAQDLSAIDAEKLRAVKDATFPVDWLGITDDGVTLHGLPFAQASTAEQIRVSVAMGIALNPRLKVLLIRDGNALDARSLALIAEMAHHQHAQVWIERVAETGEGVSVLIEDGTVAQAVGA